MQFECHHHAVPNVVDSNSFAGENKHIICKDVCARGRVKINAIINTAITIACKKFNPIYFMLCGQKKKCALQKGHDFFVLVCCYVIYLEIVKIYAGCVIGPCFICFGMSKPTTICVTIFVCKSLNKKKKEQRDIDKEQKYICIR